MDMYIMYVVS